MAHRPLPKTRFLVEPPPGVVVAPDIFRLAIRELEITPERGASNKSKAAFNLHQARKAHALLRGVDWSAFDRYWVEGGNEWQRRHDKAVHSLFEGPKSKSVSAEVKREVARRDGWTCRYCGLRVITSATMTALERRLPAALPRAEKVHESIGSHPMQCVLRLTWDHVDPHAQGGGSTADNVVVTCGTCNFQKGNCSLDELSLQDPFDSSPVSSEWDGLDGRLGARPL